MSGMLSFCRAGENSGSYIHRSVRVTTRETQRMTTIAVTQTSLWCLQSYGKQLGAWGKPFARHIAAKRLQKSPKRQKFAKEAFLCAPIPD
jgi:hypothetical protein